MPKPTGFHETFARALAGVSPHALTLDETGSTNDDARALAMEGAPSLAVVIADHQTAGRGRSDRTWVSPPGTSLLASWVVRPSLPVERWSLIPLLAGLAASDAIRARAHVDAVLKWPNDLLVGERKLGGVLVEAQPPAYAVVGLGVNVSQTSFPSDLEATSIALEEGIRLDRADLLAETLRAFDAALTDVDEAVERYRARCVTLGRRVRISRVAGEKLGGIATAIDDVGSLVVDGARIVAGDVVHVR